MERNIIGFFLLIGAFIGYIWLVCYLYENDDIVGCDGPKWNAKHSKYVQLCRHQIKFGWFRIVFSSPWIPFETRGIYIYRGIMLVSMMWTIREQLGRFEILKYSKYHSKHSFFGIRLRIISLKESQIKFPFREHFHGPLWPIYGKKGVAIKCFPDISAQPYLEKVSAQNILLPSVRIAESRKLSKEEFLKDPGSEPWKSQYLDLRGVYLDKELKISKSYYGGYPLDSQTFRKMQLESEACKKHFFEQVYERMSS